MACINTLQNIWNDIQGMNNIFRKIKYWWSDQRHIRGHNANANRLIKDQNKRWYRVKSNTLIKILTELEKKAGLGSYDIVPFLKKIDLMSDHHMKTEKENSKFTIDRQSNTDFFNELQELGFIKVIDNKLFSYLNGIQYPTPSKDCVLIVKLLPKGLDKIKEHKNSVFDKRLRILLALFSTVSLALSIATLSKPTNEQYDKLEKKVDSITNIMNQNKEKKPLTSVENK